MSNPSGGYAFPSEAYKSIGMTLRDYFAARAMSSFVGEIDPRDEDVSHRAKWAYRVADAMLAEREKATS
jgi:hypothetical protein